MASDNRPLLLDVNALMALAWPNHQFHTAIRARLEQESVSQWATCALTQLGFVRLSSNPKIVEVRKTPAEVVDLLADLIRNEQHVYLDSLPAVSQMARVFRPLHGHQQVTDAYLLGVAETHDAILLTLDRRVPTGRMRAHVEILKS